MRFFKASRPSPPASVQSGGRAEKRAAAAQPFPHLLSAGAIGTLQLKNRIVMAPMGSNLSEEDGCCGARLQHYYEERARGGAGLLILEVAAVCWPRGASNPNQVGISEDRFVPGLRELTDRVHRHGGKIAVQLQHAGKVAVRDIAAGRPLLAPSIPHDGKDEMMYALSEEESAAFVKAYTEKGAKISYQVASKEDLQQLMEDFAEAVERARQAGFDGVELHAGHGYIFSSFLSPHSNRREDEYGGALENRARLLLDTVRTVRRRVGRDFPLWCRMDAVEFRVPDGIKFDDACRTAVLLEQAGVDAIHLSAYANSSSGIAFTDAPLVHKPRGLVHFATALRPQMEIPVIAVGRIEAHEGERLIGAGKVDFIAMGRKLLADPQLPNKLAAGRPQDICPCVYCYHCVSRIFVNDPLWCTANPVTGEEHLQQHAPPPVKRTVLVVGGGPAGMQAAISAAQRGHRVLLHEGRPRLGGTGQIAALLYEENGRLVEYLIEQLKVHRVEVHCASPIDTAAVQRIAPDAVIVATGAARPQPDLPGVELPHVYGATQLQALLEGTADAALRSRLPLWQNLLLSGGARLGLQRRRALLRRLSHWWMPLGRRIAIVGGGLVGVELAEFLAQRGRSITILEQKARFGLELSIVRRWRVLDALQHHGVRMLSGARVITLQKGGLEYLDGADSARRSLEADHVLLALGTVANPGLAHELQALDAQLPVHTAGDCNGVGYLQGAMRQGRQAGLAV